MAIVQDLKPRGIFMWATYKVPTPVAKPNLVQANIAAGNAEDTLVTAKSAQDAAFAAFKINPSPANKTAYFDSRVTTAIANNSAINALTKQQTLQSDPSNNGTITPEQNSVPIKLLGIQRIRVNWIHDIGNRQGLTANFLQPWYSRPVEIEIEGESYLGAYGGESVSSQLNAQNATIIDKFNTTVTNQVNNAIQAVSNTVSSIGTSIVNAIPGVKPVTNFLQSSQLIQKLAASTKQSFGPQEDQSVANLQELISFFDHGPVPWKGKGFRDTKFVLIIENEPTGVKPVNSYASFQGFIRNFSYTEDISAPFVYTYTLQFVGESIEKVFINGGKLQAQQETSKIGITQVGTGGGAKFLLTQGIGV